MIYHILNDEKFSDWVIDSFEKVNSGGNIFLLVSNSGNSKILNDGRVRILSKIEFLRSIKPETDDFFIFYFLHLHSIQFLNKYRHLTYKKAWIGYGADYYYYLLREPYFPALYKEFTLKIFNSHYRRNFFKKFLLKLYQSVFFQLRVKRAIGQLDYFAPILPNEFRLLQKAYEFPKLGFLEFTFGDIEYLSGDLDKCELGDKILLNNSSTFSGNHIDILGILSFNRVTKKVIIPLSYGNEFYKNKIIEYTRVNLSDQVELLIDFIPRDQYFRKLQECGFVIMGHVRQQAMGNIYGALFIGAKLFLYKKNPVYDFLSELGVVVFTIEEIKGNSKALEIPLTESQKASNKLKICDFYSRHASLERVMKISKL